MSQPPSDQQGFRINKEVNLGEIVSLLTMIGFIIGMYIVQTNQITKLESSDSSQWRVIGAIKDEQRTMKESIKADYNRLDDKLEAMSSNSNQQFSEIKNILIQMGRDNGN